MMNWWPWRRARAQDLRRLAAGKEAQAVWHRTQARQLDSQADREAAEAQALRRQADAMEANP